MIFGVIIVIYCYVVGWIIIVPNVCLYQRMYMSVSTDVYVVYQVIEDTLYLHIYMLHTTYCTYKFEIQIMTTSMSPSDQTYAVKCDVIHSQ